MAAPSAIRRQMRSGQWTGPARRRSDTIMTNRIAMGLFFLVLVAVAVDLALGLGGSLFLARKFLGLIEWIAFWR
jgi:hypothetical protein